MSRDAFIGVLACARAADGAYPEAERTLVNLICQNHLLTKGLEPQRYQHIVQDVKRRIDEIGWTGAINEYLSALPPDWAYTTLLSVIDICLIDADEDQSERRCIDAVAGHFAVPAEHVENFMHWFRVKNGLLLEDPTMAQQAAAQVA